MAGITNAPFRTLCREQGAGLFVSEMVTARALIERRPETLRMIVPGKGEWPRSVQLYSVDPTTMRAAVTMIGKENLADHIDMNFGCPVPKVTRKGGGAALPFKRKLFSNIVQAAVEAAKPFGIPVTVKMRIGIDSDHETYLEAAQSAADLGVAWVALHARTAAQMYEGKADWSAITRLVDHLKPTGVPVLGNGDIWSGSDAVAMIEQTGCAGVVVGRGCLGRPWLFTDLVAALKGEDKQITPTLHEVREVMFRHAQLIVEYLESEDRGMRDIRKHMAWYLKGFRVPREIRHDLGMVSSLQEMRDLLDQLEQQPYPVEIGEKPRGRTSHGRAPTLPDGWLNDPDELVHVELEDAFSGGQMFLFRWIRRTITIIVILALVGPTYAVAQVWRAANNPIVRQADVIVVLGAAQLDGKPGEALEARLVEAKRIFDLGLAPTIITVGGGAPGDRTTEGASGKYWLRMNGIIASKITAVEVGRDTLQSTKAYTKIMKKRYVSDVIIVTDAYHCKRAMTMANDEGVVSTCSPVQTGPNTLENSGYRYLVREAAAYLSYITVGRRGINVSDRLPDADIVTKVLP